MKTLRALAFVLTCALTGAVHAGSLHNGVCYQSFTDATNAYFGSAPPVVTAGATSYLHEYRFNDGAWQTVVFSRTTGAWVQHSSVIAPPLVGFPACDPAQSFLDGITVGWGVGSVLIAVASIALMRRAAK